MALRRRIWQAMTADIDPRLLYFWRYGPIVLLLPELLHFESARERRAVFDEIAPQRHWLHVGLKWFIIAQVMLVFVVMQCMPRRMMIASAGVTTWSIVSLPVLLFGLILILYFEDVVSALLYRGRYKRAIRERRIRGGAEICANCGYDMRGLEKRRCPECGHQGTIRSGRPAAGPQEQ